VMNNPQSSNAQAKEVLAEAVPSSKVNDLSELGAQFKGYAPKPEKGQSLDSFVREELGKKSIEWGSFIKTDYYRDHVELFSEMLKANEAGVAEASVSPSGGANMSATGNVPAPTTPEKIVEIQASTVVIKDDVPAATGQGPSLAVLPLAGPVIRDTLPSLAVIVTSPEKFVHQLTYARSYSPKNDPKEKQESQLTFIRGTFKDYTGLIVGVKNEYVPEDRNMKTVGNQFPMKSYYENDIHGSQKGTLLEGYRRTGVPDSPDEPFKYDREIQYYGLRQEAVLLSALDGIERRHLFEIHDKYEFMRLWDSITVMLAPLSPTVIADKTRVFMNIDFHNYQLIMDKDPEFAQLIYGYVKENIRTSVAIGVTPDRTVLAKLFATIKFSTSRITYMTNFTDTVMRSGGSNVLYDVLAVNSMNRWTEMNVTIAIGEESVATIIGILCAKLLTPERVWSKKAIIAMHNYLAYWLISALPWYKGTHALQDFHMGGDMLKRLLGTPTDFGGVAGTNLQHLRNFLLNWADVGGQSSFQMVSANGSPVPTSMKNAVRVQPLFHRNYLVESMTEHTFIAPGDDMTYQQLRNFDLFVQVLELANGPRGWKRLQKDSVEPLIALCRMIQSRSESIARMMFGLNYISRGTSLHTFTGAMKDQMFTNPDRVTVTMADPVTFFNAILTTDVERIEEKKFDMTMYDKSLGIHEMLGQLGDGLHIARKYLNSPLWKSSEIIKAAFEFVGNHPIKAWFLDELLRRKKETPYKDLRPDQYISDKLAAVESFLTSLGPSLLKFTPSFIFMNGCDTGVLNLGKSHEVLRNGVSRYRLLTTAKRSVGLPELTLRQFEELFRTQQLGKYLIEHPGPIRMNFPISLSSGPPLVEVKQAIKLSNQVIVEDSVYVGYRFGDDKVMHESDEFAMLARQVFCSEITPWVDVDDDYPRTNMIHKMIVWSELDLSFPVDYILVRRV